MKTTAAPLPPWIYRRVSKRFVCFYTYLGEICATEALPPNQIMSKLITSYEEKRLVANWMERAGAGDFYPVTPKSVVVCVKGRRTRKEKQE
ncbi:MAG TPA: hypothetical protein VGX03_02600 [Candidatus Binatia bacterium]|nr:hypothetical protein [Candidatus Binatia bacterium]